MSPTRIGLVLFSAAALAGPWYTVDGYAVAQNVVSELGAQNTRNGVVMVAGFLALGLGLIADGLRKFQLPALPFVAFGVFMALAGLFGHKPLDPLAHFSERTHVAHGAFAALAGVSITSGLVWHAIRTQVLWMRSIAFVLAFLCIALPLTMLALPAYQGVIQRIMYLLIFAWLWAFFPDLHTDTSPLDRGSPGKPGRAG